MKDFGAYLIDEHLDIIASSLLNHSAVLVKAGPGAGKTTRLPLYLLSRFPGKILVLEPRRLAARLSAERAAWFLGEECGEVVGYSVRQESKVGAKTRLHFVTEGLFVRMLQDDPLLTGVGMVVLDEFHERHLSTDISLALVRRLQDSLRPDLKLLVMSATLDSKKLEDYLGEIPSHDIAGKTWPVTISYHPNPHKHWDEHASQSILKMLDDPGCPGHILVFLPGLGEIRRLEQNLALQLPDDCMLLALAADLKKEEQAQVFKEWGKRKVILATNVAETSLTILGVSGVVDLGLAKKASLAHWSGMNVLELVPISQAEAIQRAGRAGRTQAGIVYRLYAESDFRQRPAFFVPEILRADLSPMMLDLMALQVSADELPWFEAPAQKQLGVAQELLRRLDARDEKGQLTAWGKRIARLPLHPRLAAVTLAGVEQGIGELALWAACLLSEGALRGKLTAATSFDCDVCEFASKKNQRDFPGARFLYERLARILKLGHLPTPPFDQKKLTLALLWGYPDRVAMRRVQENKEGAVFYNFCLGRGGKLASSSALFPHPPAFLLALETSENVKEDAASATLIRLASTIDKAQLALGPGAMYFKKEEKTFSESSGKTIIEEKTYYGELIIENQRKDQGHADSGELAQYVKKNWPLPFKDLAPLEEYHGRLRALELGGIAHQCPYFQNEMLELLIESICHGKKKIKEIKSDGLSTYIKEELSEEDCALLARFAPLEFKAKNGRQFKIHYEEKGVPWLECLIQDLYGLAETPKVAGLVPIRLHLLTPGKRPAQITVDLKSFWAGNYKEVKKELAGRYPKHHWPEDPAKAPAILLKKNL